MTRASLRALMETSYTGTPAADQNMQVAQPATQITQDTALALRIRQAEIQNTILEAVSPMLPAMAPNANMQTASNEELIVHARQVQELRATMHTSQQWAHYLMENPLSRIPDVNERVILHQAIVNLMEERINILEMHKSLHVQTLLRYNENPAYANSISHAQECSNILQEHINLLRRQVAQFLSSQEVASSSPVLRGNTRVYAARPTPEPEMQELALATPYFPQLVDKFQTRKFELNTFIEAMKQEQDPPAVFHRFWSQALEDLGKMTMKMQDAGQTVLQDGIHTIGPKNQVEFVQKRVWAKMANLCLTRQRMGAICIGNDSEENSDFENNEVWHIFEQVAEVSAEASQTMCRMRQLVHLKSFDLTAKLVNFDVGVDIISCYNVENELSILLSMGRIDVFKYIAETKHSCPFCRTLITPNLLEFEKQEFDMGSCCLLGSELCAENEVPVACLPCPTCNPKTDQSLSMPAEEKEKRNPIKICRFCLPQFVMAKRI